ncbi:MAG: NAD-binding protein [Deltaproteobacteria bacterium]|nr:NAD-binding protein [Deltaproteobacteria bacterium]
MARYLILGAGKFGRLALARLARQEPAASFVVVDRRPEALAAARGLDIPKVEWVAAEAIAFLAAHLTDEPPWDWLIPMAPVHVAGAWLLASPQKNWQTAAVPEELGQLAKVAFRGPEGQIYLSRASHLCPDDCPEPDSICPVSNESRQVPLYAELAAVNLPGWSIWVIPSRQLAPGVGGYPSAALLALGRELTEEPGKVLVATACRCHGVVHGIRRAEEKLRSSVK